MHRIWQSGEDRLVEHDGVLWLIDAAGTVKRRYPMHVEEAQEVDEWSYKLTYFVEGDKLCLRNEAWPTYYSQAPTIEVTTQLDGLSLDETPETRAFIEKVLRTQSR